MTHEHLDHVQGLPWAANRGLDLAVDYAWITASAAPGYYARYPEARKRMQMARRAWLGASRHLAMSPAAATPAMRALLNNNNARDTSRCVRYLGKLARRRTTYLHRETRLRVGIHHPFVETRFEVLAPERNTATYYGHMRPLPLATAAGAEDANASEPPGPPADPLAPVGVDPAAFARLLATWRGGVAGNLLSIDRAANNTSIVFVLEWRGWQLLFCGDAEMRSWRMMQSRLTPVHFLKVGHHGSHNATPPDAILERVLPASPSDGRRRSALVSTCCGSYAGVPHAPTLARIARRCGRVVSTADVAPGQSVYQEFRG